MQTAILIFVVILCQSNLTPHPLNLPFCCNCFFWQSCHVFLGKIIDIIYYHVIWTDNGSTLPEANTHNQEGKYPVIKVLQGCILKLLLHSVNLVPILYRTGNMQSTILSSFVSSSSLLPCGLQSTQPRMLCYISPYVVYNVYKENKL